MEAHSGLSALIVQNCEIQKEDGIMDYGLL